MNAGHPIPERLVPGTLSWQMYEVEHRQRYEFFAPRCRGHQVLDAACGVGYGSQILREHGAARVVGIDLAFDAANYGNIHFGESAHFLSGNVERLPFRANSFDAVLSFETIEHVPNPALVLDEVKRLLKPNGWFVCSTPNKEFVPASGIKPHNPYHESEMNWHEFHELVARRFEIKEQYFQSHSPSFLRYLKLLQQIEKLNKPIRYSGLLRLENALRRLLGRECWQEPTPLPASLSHAMPGDFVIEPLSQISPTLLTFVIVASPKY